MWDWNNDQALKRASVTRMLHPPAFSAQRRANYMHEPGRRVVKSVLFQTERGPVLALVPADCRVSTARLGAMVGVERMRIATVHETRQIFPDCDFGRVPGFGSPYSVPCVMDEQLRSQPYLLLPANCSMIDVKVATEVFAALECPLQGPIAEKIVHTTQAKSSEKRRVPATSRAPFQADATVPSEVCEAC